MYVITDLSVFPVYLYSVSVIGGEIISPPTHTDRRQVPRIIVCIMIAMAAKYWSIASGPRFNYTRQDITATRFFVINLIDRNLFRFSHLKIHIYIFELHIFTIENRRTVHWFKNIKDILSPQESWIYFAEIDDKFLYKLNK